MNIRNAITADAPGIARVSVDSGRDAYQGIVPDLVLEGLSYETLGLQIATRIAQTAVPDFILVADDPAHGIVSFVRGGPEFGADSHFAGEVFQLYVHPAHQRRGLGYRLIGAAAEQLARGDRHSLLLWVFTNNDAARRFYERMGGIYIGEREIEFFGARTREMGYGWHDTQTLIKACREKERYSWPRNPAGTGS